VTLQDSLTAECLGVRGARVNSFHHQAVEATDRAFTAGVQWHAESMIGSPEQDRLLAAFAEVALSSGPGPARRPEDRVVARAARARS